MKKIGLIEISDNADVEKLESEAFRNVKKRFKKEYGYEVVEGKRLRKGIHETTPKKRAKDLNKFFKNPSIDFVWPIGWGWCANDILPHIDYDMIAKNHKPFMGYSDITVINNALWARSWLVNFSWPGMGGYRNPWFGQDHMYQQFEDIFIEWKKEGSLWNLHEFVDYWEIDEEKNPDGIVRDEWTRVVQQGKWEGTIIWGNLSTMGILAGTPYDPSFEEVILFLEECGESSMGDIRRDLMHLRQSHDCVKVRWIVFGKINKVCHREIDLDLDQCLLDVFGDLDIPIISWAPFGHIYPFQIFPIGGKCTIDTKNESYTMSW